MADYGTKFRFRWQAANGADYEIDIKEKGYSGTVYDRAMGAAPQLKRENNGHIYGTSLDIYAECKVDGEFSSLYTSDPTMYQVELYQDSVLMWIGFVSPELYSEPDIAPPYDVTIVATDCLGELKLHDWEPEVKSQSILAHLNYLMSFSGLDLLWRSITSMRTSEAPYRTILDTATVDLSDMEGKTCYEVLESILTSINANITQQSGNWLLFRRNDAVFAGHTSLAYDFLSGGNSGSYPVAQVGTMRSCAYWPVGQLTSEIEPAVKSVTVKAPNYYKESAIKVEDFVKNSYATWLPVSETRDRASWKLEGFHSYVDPSSGASYQGNLDKATRGVVSQSISFEQATPGLALTLEIGSDETMGSSGLTCRAKVYYTLDGTDYYLQVYKSDGESGQENSWYATEGSIWATVGAANEISTTEFYLPPMPAGVTLTVAVEGSILSSKTASYAQYTSYLYGAYLTYASEFAGQQLKVNLSNNAREDLSEIEAIFSTWSSSSGSNPDVLKFRNGIVALDGAPVTNWQSAKLGAQDYLGFITMDYALESALPRLVKTGKIWFPAPLNTSEIVPIAFYDGQYDYLVDTFTLDLIECEMDVKMTSLPAASLTVESQVRTALPEGGSSSRGSSGSGSGGGSGAGGTVTSVGLTMPAGFTVSDSPVTESGTLNVTLNSDRVLPTTTQKGQWDEAYSQKHTHDNKDVIDGISADQVTLWDKVASGKVIKSSVVKYGVSYSGTEKPTYWMSYVPSISLGMYLWTRVTTTYTDGTTLIAYSVSRQGKNGAGIASETIEYGISTSASVKPTSWSESVPTSFSQGNYLWTRTTLTFDDGTTSVSYSVSYIGTDGSGISGIVVEYASGSSGVSAPTSGWSTSVPSVDQGKYLWTRMTISYTDGRDNKISYSVSYQGTDGSSEPGLPGCIYRQSKWEPGKVYRNDQVGGTTASDGLRYIDVCTDVAIALLSDSFNMYICQKTHTSDSTTNTLGKSGLWTSVGSTTPMATSLLLSKQIIADYIDTNSLTSDEAFIEQLNSKNIKSREITTENISGFLHMAGNVLQMFNSSGNERLRVHGGTLTDLSTSTYKDPTSTTTASGTKTFTNTSTKSYTTTRTIRTRTISSAMVLTLPEQSVTISATGSIDGDRKDTYDAQVCVEWLVDGTVKSSVYGTLSVDYSSQSASALLTLPAAVVNVDSGSHSIVIRTSIDYMGGIEITSGDAMTVSSSTQVSASSVVWATSVQKTEIANNGFRVALSSTVYFTVNLTNSVSTIQMMNGSYGLKLTSSGLYKTTNGGSTWTSL